ncbi:MAG: dipeptide epimerase [Candidatus Wallbacteria bacterium]|nr:dipeptide epimerase [Candidatus Wallbacteria bacterium]
MNIDRQIPEGCRIARVQAAPLDVPLLEPFGISLGTMHRLRNVLVKVDLEDGHHGIGEAAPFPELTGETQATVLAAVEQMGDLLRGVDATSFRLVHEKLAAVFRAQSSARAGVVSALFDALGRRAGLPLHRWFGGRGTRVETDLTIPIVDGPRAAERACEIRKMGIRTIKTKVGHDLEGDLARVFAIHEAYPEAGLVVDANQGFTPKEALTFLQELEENGVRPLLLEQPVHRDDLRGMAMVRGRANVPVYADESVFSASDAWRVLQAGAADGINIKLAKCGGFVEAMDIAALCRAAGAGLMIGAMMETRLGLTASAHFAAGTGGFRFCDLDTHMLLAEDPFQAGFLQDGPTLELGESPGLGVTKRQ